MSDWKRLTKEIPFENLPPQMVSAAHKHIEGYNLDPILADALMCIQTDSERVKKGLFGKPEAVQVGTIVTPRWLIWAVQGANAQTAVLSAQLSRIAVQDYIQTPLAKMIPDTGMEVHGLFTGAGESASAFIGLADNVAGSKFKGILMNAAQNAKK